MATDSISVAMQDAIHDFVIAATGLAVGKVIWSMPDADRPAPPYISLNVSSGPRSIGSPEVIHKAQDVFTFPFRKEFTLTVNSFAASGWHTLIAAVMNALELPSKQALLTNAGIAIMRAEDPIDLSGLLETGFEGRGAVDIMLGYTTEIDDTTGEIQTVEISQTVGDVTSTNTIP